MFTFIKKQIKFIILQEQNKIRDGVLQKKNEICEPMLNVCELIGNLFSEYKVLNVKCKY